MKARPVIFGADSVRAILAGRKTQTRRVVKSAPLEVVRFLGKDSRPTGEYGLCLEDERVITKHVCCPYGVPGDRLWVRETWAARPRFIDGVARSEVVYAATPRIGIRTPGVIRDVDHMCYLADETPLERHGFGWPIKWRSPILMPRWASRIWLEVTEVRVQRLQEITRGDAMAEGIEQHREGAGHEWDNHTSVENYALGWDSLNARRGHGWSTNPWVWAINFVPLGGGR